MERPSSSEIRSVRAAAALASLAVASAAVLLLSPVLAVAAAPIAFGLTDVAAAHALSAPSPSIRVRVVSRALASLAWGGSISAIVASRGGDIVGAGVRLPLLAIALAVGAVLGAYGSAGEAGPPPRPPLTEAPLIGVADVATAGWLFVTAVGAHGTELRTRVTLLLAASIGLALRALVVARVAIRGAHDPEAPALAAIGFVLWIGIAAIFCALASTPITWSGLGAAIVLSFAAALAERRHRRALPVLLRGSLAFAFAAMLGIATFLQL